MDKVSTKPLVSFFSLLRKPKHRREAGSVELEKKRFSGNPLTSSPGAHL